MHRPLEARSVSSSAVLSYYHAASPRCGQCPSCMTDTIVSMVMKEDLFALWSGLRRQGRFESTIQKRLIMNVIR